MCSVAAVTAVQTGMNIAGTVMNASAQDERAKEVWTNARQNLVNAYNQTQLREQQEITRTGQQIINTQKAGQSTASRVRVRAAEGGISGATATEQEGDVNNRVSDFAAAAKANLAGELEQGQMEAEHFRAQAISTINSIQPVSPIALGMDIAGELSQGASQDISKLTPGQGVSLSTFFG